MSRVIRRQDLYRTYGDHDRRRKGPSGYRLEPTLFVTHAVDPSDWFVAFEHDWTGAWRR